MLCKMFLPASAGMTDFRSFLPIKLLFTHIQIDKTGTNENSNYFTFQGLGLWRFFGLSCQQHGFGGGTSEKRKHPFESASLAERSRGASTQGGRAAQEMVSSLESSTGGGWQISLLALGRSAAARLSMTLYRRCRIFVCFVFLLLPRGRVL